MEGAMEVDEKKELLDGLTEAQELAAQLDAIFDQPSPVMGSQGRPLTQRLLQCIKSAISMATKSPTTSDCEQSPDPFQAQSRAVLGHFRGERPSSTSIITSSASSTTTGSAIPATAGLFRRKAMKRSLSVRAGESLGDDYVWRKFGHKNILGSKYPREYYRCTYNNECQALKKVQRADDDPETLHVTYFDSHTCLESQRPSSKPPLQIERAEAAQPPHDSVSASTTEAAPETPRRFKETCGGDDERDVGNW